MSNNKPSNATVIDVCTQRLNAMKQYVQPNTPIAVNGAQKTAADVTAVYQSCIDSRAVLATARAGVKTDMATVASNDATRAVTDRALKGWVNAQFGVGSTQAIAFGFPAPKKPGRSPAAKVKAVAQNRATRTARNTMGPKAKLAIKGTVPETEPGGSPATGPASAQSTQSTQGAPAAAVANGAAAKS
jgi:hypothetical protein